MACRPSLSLSTQLLELICTIVFFCSWLADGVLEPVEELPMSRLTQFKKNPRQLLFSLMADSSRLWPDKLYIRLLYWHHLGGIIHYSKPGTFNQIMNWSKIYDRNPFYTELADKYRVKQYVKELLGEDAVVPCYGVWDHFQDIDFDRLPERFVLKCTHDSSGAIICRDKATFNYDKARSRINKSLATNYYWRFREWPYKNIPRRIIADEFLDDGSGHELQDYKFWCFNGEPRVMYITNKGVHIYENFYDMDFRPLGINHGFERKQPEYSCPKGFKLMKEYASKLSKGMPFVRIDFFEVNGHVYFGEFTFYDWAGLRPFKTPEWDKEIGSWIKLNNSPTVM